VLFKKAYEWSGNQRIDFLAANAGTAERDHIILGNPLNPEDVDGEPRKPELVATNVNQIGVLFGVKLMIHYARRTNKRLGGIGKGGFTPKIVITSSCTGIYPFPVVPEYCMTVSRVLLGLGRANWVL
jgi:NAD(P)-dependent dehydrogenase (short-subunit alcohol dehydrogenase family)